MRLWRTSSVVEELVQERGVSVDHSTINRWVVKYSPQREEAFHSTAQAPCAALRTRGVGVVIHPERVLALPRAHTRPLRRWGCPHVQCGR
jgi:hypothetical protein